MVQKCFSVCRFPSAQCSNVCHGFLRDRTNRVQDFRMICDVRAINSSEQVVGLLMPNGPRPKRTYLFTITHLDWQIPTNSLPPRGRGSGLLPISLYGCHTKGGTVTRTHCLGKLLLFKPYFSIKKALLIIHFIFLITKNLRIPCCLPD